MNFIQFPGLPAQLKLQIIGKCQPVAYSRLRRTCKLMDEFCEKHRKSLSIYYHKKGIQVALEKKEDTPLRIILYSETDGEMVYSIEISDANKSLSGFGFREISVAEFLQESVEETFDPILEALPNFHIKKLNLCFVTAEHTQRIMESTWKIGEIQLFSTSDIVNIAKLDTVKKLDYIRCRVSAEDLSSEDLAEVISAKTYVDISYCDSLCPVCPLNTIYTSWKEAGDFPLVFEFKWETDETFHQRSIADFCKRIGIVDVLYLGCISAKDCENSELKWDIWIKKEGERWQLFYVKRILGSGCFVAYSPSTARDLKMWLFCTIRDNNIQPTCGCCQFDLEELLTLCLCDPETALTQLQECFAEMVPCAQMRKIKKNRIKKTVKHGRKRKMRLADFVLQ